MAMAEPPFKRLMRNYTINPKTGCWEWKGRPTKSGYGLIKVFGKMVSVHVFSYRLHKGDIPDGMEVMHDCDNKICINPSHLAVGTHQQNMRDAVERGLIRLGINSPVHGRAGVAGIKRSQSIQVFVKGKKYGSKKEAEKHLGLGAGTVNWWIKNKPELAHIITREEYLNAE